MRFTSQKCGYNSLFYCAYHTLLLSLWQLKKSKFDQRLRMIGPFSKKKITNVIVTNY